MNYTVVIERAKNNYSAYTLDDTGCIGLGDTIEETLESIQKSLDLMVEVAIEKQWQIPEAKNLQYYLDSGEYTFEPNDLITYVTVKIPSQVLLEA